MMKKIIPIYIIILTIFGIIIFSLVLKGFSGNPAAVDMKNMNEYSLRDRGRFLLIQNLVNNRTFALTKEQADLAAPDVGYYKGNWFELYPPGLSVMAIPFYLLGMKFNLSLIFTFIMGGITAIGIMLYIFLISKNILQLPAWASLFASMVFGFASTSLGYATSLFQHHSAAFFIISGFYSVYKYKISGEKGYIHAIYIWFIYGFSIYVDYPNAILMLPIILYFFITSLKIESSDRSIKVKLNSVFVLTSIVFFCVVSLHGYYNYINFGGVTKLSGSLAGYYEGVQNDLELGNSAEVDRKITLAETNKKPVNFFKEEKVVNGFKTQLFFLDRGLFVYSPIFILSLFGIIYSLRKLNAEIITLISIIFVSIFFYSSWGDPNAGWSFGPRYLIPVMPILAIFVSQFLFLNRCKQISKFITFLLFVLSCIVAVLGAITTNAVPPATEAAKLGAEHGLNFNINYLINEKTSSFLFNEFFRGNISLQYYYFIILGVITTIGFVTLFILPRFEKENV